MRGSPACPNVRETLKASSKGTVKVQCRLGSMTQHWQKPMCTLVCIQVFDDQKQFKEWFGGSFGQNGPAQGDSADDWMEHEMRVAVVHRLHQILEPFMLRRQVQDVEGKLPPKVHIAACTWSKLHTEFATLALRITIALQVIQLTVLRQPHTE